MNKHIRAFFLFHLYFLLSYLHFLYTFLFFSSIIILGEIYVQQDFKLFFSKVW